jgi:hypothetical protein
MSGNTSSLDTRAHVFLFLYYLLLCSLVQQNCKGGAANVELCFQVMLEALNTHWSMFYLNPSAPLQNESIFIHLFEAVYAALRSPELNLFKLCLLRV